MRKPLKSTQITNKNKKISKRERKRREFEREKLCVEPLFKKRKKNMIEPECVWLLIDMAHTMSTHVIDDDNHQQTKFEVARDLIEKMVQSNWKKGECKLNHFRLFSFSNMIHDLTKKPYTGYSMPLATRLMTKVYAIGFEKYENCISYKEALNALIDVIVIQKKKMDLGLDRNRILLFTDAERSKCGNVQHLDLMSKLRRNKIVLDCIHITKLKRDHNNLKALCEDGDIGKYFNPINKTKRDYDAIMNAEIMTDITLRNSTDSIVID